MQLDDNANDNATANNADAKVDSNAKPKAKDESRAMETDPATISTQMTPALQPGGKWRVEQQEDETRRRNHQQHRNQPLNELMLMQPQECIRLMVVSLQAQLPL